MPRIVTIKTIAGNDHLAVITTPDLDIVTQAGFVTNAVDPGREFWYFAAIPPGQVIGCDFNGAPTAETEGDFVERRTANLAKLQAITVQPEDVLTFA